MKYKYQAKSLETFTHVHIIPESAIEIRNLAGEVVQSIPTPEHRFERPYERGQIVSFKTAAECKAFVAAHSGKFEAVRPNAFMLFDSGKTGDRYTVLHTTPVQGEILYFGFNSSPYHPQGIGMHGSMPASQFDPSNTKHLGKRIDISDLPETARAAVPAFVREFDPESI